MQKKKNFRYILKFKNSVWMSSIVWGISGYGPINYGRMQVLHPKPVRERDAYLNTDLSFITFKFLQIPKNEHLKVCFSHGMGVKVDLNEKHTLQSDKKKKKRCPSMYGLFLDMHDL